MEAVVYTPHPYNCYLSFVGDLVNTISDTPNVIIKPPEKLVLEAEAFGAYSAIEWLKNGLSASPSNPNNFPGDPRIFPNFFEFHVQDPTNENTDLGIYTVGLVGVGTFAVNLIVTSYGEHCKHNYSYVSDIMIADNYGITCWCSYSGLKQ